MYDDFMDLYDVTTTLILDLRGCDTKIVGYQEGGGWMYFIAWAR